MNPLEIIKNYMSGGLTPKGIAMKLLNNNPNPMLKNLVEMAEKGQNDKIEEFARNLFREQNRDFDQEFGEFMKNFK